MGNPVKEVPVEEKGNFNSWNSLETTDCRLRVVNNSDLVVDVLWVTPFGKEASYRVLKPGELHLQATYTTHVWRLRAVLRRRLLVEHLGGDSTLEVLHDGTVIIRAGYRPDIVPTSAHPPPVEWGAYRVRATTAVGVPITAWDCPCDAVVVGAVEIQHRLLAGVPIQPGYAVEPGLNYRHIGCYVQAWDCVCDAAVVGAADILERMLAGTPSAVRQRLVAAGCDVAIIGRNQVTSDTPAHNGLKGGDAADGKRTFDDGCRGVGGSPMIPTTSCGEENVTMVDDRWYPCEQILIHEFGHTVMDVGLSVANRDAVLAAYRAAMKRELYDADCYMGSNPQEYWAEGTQAWFDASARSDVNSGINSRAALKAHDPALAALMVRTYGDGEWRYPQTAPAAFVPHASKRVVRCRTTPQRGMARRFLSRVSGAACCLPRISPAPAAGSGASLVRRLFGSCLPSQRQYSKVV